MRRLHHKLIAVSLAALASVGLASSGAAATPSPDVPSRSIRVTPAALSQPGGIEALYRRIRQAAREVCAAYDAPDVESFAHFRHCVSDATARAITDAHIPQLTRRYADTSRERILPPVAARLNR